MALNDRDYMRDDKPADWKVPGKSRKRPRRSSAPLLARFRFWLWCLFNGKAKPGP